MFKPVTTNAIDIKKEKDTPRVGTFVGKTDIVTKIGPQVIWNFMDDDGIPFGIFGFTNLNSAMASVRDGSTCRVTYLGTKFIKTKYKPAGQDVHQALVEVDDNSEGQDASPEAA